MDKQLELSVCLVCIIYGIALTRSLYKDNKGGIVSFGIETRFMEGNDMGLYWVSLLVQETENSKPWLCAVSDGCLSLEEARDVIEKGKKNYRILSAWIDTFDKNNKKTTVFHKCYINAVGMIL